MQKNGTKIIKIFNQLKNRKLIQMKTRLVKSKNVFNLKAASFRDVILYNPIILSISEESLRFALLHEQGHKQKFQWSHFVIGISAGVAIFFWLFLITLKIFSVLILTSSIVIVFLVTFCLFKPLVKKDEYNADLFAAEQLKAEFQINKPSKIAKKTFQEISRIKLKMNILGKFLFVIYKIIQYHPTLKQRLEHIEIWEQEERD